MLRTRLLTAAVGAPLVILLTWAGGLYFWALVATAVAVGLWESTKLLLAAAPAWYRAAVSLSGFAIFAVPSLWPVPAVPLVLLLAAAVMIGLSLSLALPGEHVAAVEAGARALLVMLYVPVLFLFLPLLRRLPVNGLPDGGWAWVILTFGVTWFGDTGGYAFGRLFGRHKFAPTLSPKKTWEGLLGAMLSGVLFALLMSFWFLPELPVWACFANGLPAGLIGQMGDLFESRLKRAAGVKDSGVIVPGHGGLLDRVDALLFVGPYVYLWALFLSGELLK